MRVAIELVNSHGMSLDLRTIAISDGEEPEVAITKAMRQRLDDWVLSPGDIIRIVEL